MNALSFFGYAVMLSIASVVALIATRWIRSAWYAGKALRVLSRERRMGETLYDTAEALSGDAHNWRGMTSRDESQLLLNIARSRIGEICAAEDVSIFVEKYGFKKSAVAPQPPPVNSSGPALWPMIIRELGESETDRLVAADMLSRHEFGVAKYGVPLVASNGRDHLADAYQEALDGVVYLRAAYTNASCANGQCSNTRQLYVDMLDLAKEIRELIRERDGQ